MRKKERYYMPLSEDLALAEAVFKREYLQKKYTEQKGKYSYEQYQEAHDKNYEELKKKILKKRNVEEIDGKIILYHATTAKNLAKILKDKALRPPSETGVRAWRIEGEEDEEKKGKLYLADKKEIQRISGNIQGEFGGSVYILKVAVDDSNLTFDEDSQQPDWLYSLDFSGMCANKGRIDEYSIESKRDFQLSYERKKEYFDMPGDADTLNDQFEAEIEEGIRKEEEMLKDLLPEEE